MSGRKILKSPFCVFPIRLPRSVPLKNPPNMTQMSEWFHSSFSPTSSLTLPLPPDGVPLHQYLWPRNPCCDVTQTSSSQNYLRLLPKSKENSAGAASGYVSPNPRPGSEIQCGCQNGSSQYQNLTDHSCASSSIA